MFRAIFLFTGFIKMDLQRQEQRQNREPQKMTPELYQEILSTVAREHLRNINSELHQLQSEILERVKLSELGKKELNNFVLFASNEWSEKIKNILWS